MTIPRHDCAYPLRIDASSSQVSQSSYAQHVEELLRQLLLTSPGERVARPTFGCGLRRLVFAPQTPALTATVQLQVQQSVNQWLSDQVLLGSVTVLAGSDPDSGLDPGSLLVTVSYTLIDTQESAELRLKVI
jgi:uncharacterized protein